MKYISDRKHFLDRQRNLNRKSNIISPINEAWDMSARGPMGNDINFGDSLLGRLINSASRLFVAKAKQFQLSGLLKELRAALDMISGLVDFNSLENEDKTKMINSIVKSIYDAFLNELEDSDFSNVNPKTIKFENINLLNIQYFNQMSEFLDYEESEQIFNSISEVGKNYTDITEELQTQVTILNKEESQKSESDTKELEEGGIKSLEQLKVKIADSESPEQSHSYMNKYELAIVKTPFGFDDIGMYLYLFALVEKFNQNEKIQQVLAESFKDYDKTQIKIRDFFKELIEYAKKKNIKEFEGGIDIDNIELSKVGQIVHVALESKKFPELNKKITEMSNKVKAKYFGNTTDKKEYDFEIGDFVEFKTKTGNNENVIRIAKILDKNENGYQVEYYFTNDENNRQNSSITKRGNELRKIILMNGSTVVYKNKKAVVVEYSNGEYRLETEDGNNYNVKTNDKNITRVLKYVKSDKLVSANELSVSESRIIKRFSTFINESDITPYNRNQNNITSYNQNRNNSSNDSDIEDVDYEEIPNEEEKSTTSQTNVNKGTKFNTKTVSIDSTTIGSVTINLGNPDDIKDKMKDIWKKTWQDKFPDIENMEVVDIKPKKDVKKKINKNQLMQILMKIVNIFDRAQSKYLVDVIPTGRSNGKVSNKTYRQYKSMSKSPGSPDNAGHQGGPYLYKPSFNKWARGVKEILGAPEYQNIYSDQIIMTIGETKDGSPVKEVKFGNNLVVYMNKLINGEDLLSDKAQYEFINQLFGIEIKDKNVKSEDKENKSNVNKFKFNSKGSFDSLDLTKDYNNYLQVVELNGSINGSVEKFNVVASVVKKNNEFAQMSFITNINFLKSKIEENSSDVKYDDNFSKYLKEKREDSPLKHDMFVMKIMKDTKINDIKDFKLFWNNNGTPELVEIKDVTMTKTTTFVLRNDEYFKMATIKNFDFWKDIDPSVKPKS